MGATTIRDLEAEIARLNEKLNCWARFSMNGAANRMLNRDKSRAWEKWQFEAEEMRRLKRAMKGAVRRMTHYQLSKAWEKWQFESEEAKRQKYMVAGAINRMMKRMLSKAFEQLQWYAAKMRALQG